MKQINTYINEKLQLSAKHQYTCQPKDKYELRKIIMDRIKDEGPECDLNDIDVSKIIDMESLFDAGIDDVFADFNGDISMWNVSNVEYMPYTFNGCKKFNCDISNWNVSNVKNMYFMFYGCKKFNCDLSKWNVTNVKTMWRAFECCPTQPDWYDKNKWEL